MSCIFGFTSSFLVRENLDSLEYVISEIGLQIKTEKLCTSMLCLFFFNFGDVSMSIGLNAYYFLAGSAFWKLYMSTSIL